MSNHYRNYAVLAVYIAMACDIATTLYGLSLSSRVVETNPNFQYGLPLMFVGIILLNTLILCGPVGLDFVIRMIRPDLGDNVIYSMGVGVSILLISSPVFLTVLNNLQVIASVLGG